MQGTWPVKYLLLLTCFCGLANAEVYKWVDADGRVHYGDRPDTERAQEIDIKAAPAPSRNADDTMKNQQNIESWLKARREERKINKKRQAELQKQKSQRNRRCAELKHELKDLQRGGLWYYVDRQGQRRYYSDDDIAAQIETLKKTIKRECPA